MQLRPCLQFLDARTTLRQLLNQPGYVALRVRVVPEVPVAAQLLRDVVEALGVCHTPVRP